MMKTYNLMILMMILVLFLENGVFNIIELKFIDVKRKKKIKNTCVMQLHGV